MVVDIETTGFDPASGHRLIEVATVDVDDAAIASLVRPGRPIPTDATAVHGISDAMVADAPLPAAVAAELKRRCGDRMLAFHHAAFDLPFIRRMFLKSGVAPLFNPVVDTLGLARGLPGAGGHSLEALVERFGLPSEPLHRALGDALTTARLLLALAPRWAADKKVGTWDELAAASQDAARRTPSTPAEPPAPAPMPLFEPPPEIAPSPATVRS